MVFKVKHKREVKMHKKRIDFTLSKWILKCKELYYKIVKNARVIGESTDFNKINKKNESEKRKC